MPLPLGYLEVTTALGQVSEALTLVPIDVLVTASPINEAPQPPFGHLVAVDLPGGGTVDLQVSVTVSQNSDTAQEIGFFLVSSGLTDLRVRALVNTSFFTNVPPSSVSPTPAAGESFLAFGYQSVGAEPMPPALAGTLRIDHGTGLGARDTITIDVGSDFRVPRTYLISQMKAPAVVGTYTTAGAVTFRRADEAHLDGMRVALTASDPTAPAFSWLRVQLSNPTTGDSPLQELVCAEGTGTGDVPITGQRQYQVTWVYENGNESSATPPSAPIATSNGTVSVPLPVWPTPPTTPPPPTPGQLPISASSLPVRRRRVYRTATSDTGDAGERFLVDEIPDNTTTTYRDVTSDDDLGEPVLTDLQVHLARATAQGGTTLLTGKATVTGTLDLSSRQLDTGGNTVFRGTQYLAEIDGVPAKADVVFTTRPQPGAPRLDWRTAGATGDAAGLDVVAFTTSPTGASAGVDRPLRARVEAVPAAVGLDWWQWSSTRLRVALGDPDDLTNPLATPADLVAFQTGPTLTAPFIGSKKAVSAFLDGDDTRAAARGLRRLRLLLGLPRPAGEPGPHHAATDDGVVVDAQLATLPADKDLRRPRSLVFRRTSDVGSIRRIEARCGNVSESVSLDTSVSSTPVAGRVTGRLQRVTALIQAPEDMSRTAASAKRSDGIWVACTDSSGQLDFSVDTDKGAVTFAPEGPVRLGASVRRPAGLGGGDLVIRGIEASASVAAGSTAVSVPPSTDAGSTSLVSVISAGATVRAGVITALADDTADAYRAVRATPQVEADFGSAAMGVADLRRATARVLGVETLDLARSPAPGPHKVDLAPRRANTAFRVELTADDSRFTPAAWSPVKARIAGLAAQTTLKADTTNKSFVIDLSEPTGAVDLFAEPAIVPTDGAAKDMAVGIGLMRASIDALPTHLELDLLGPPNPTQDEPFNWSTPAGWRKSGFRILTDRELIIRGVQLISVDRSRPPTNGDPLEHFWSNTAAAIVKIALEEGAGNMFGPVWLWTPSAPLPGPGAAFGDWKDLDSAFGFRIEDKSLMTLQLNSYPTSLADSSPPVRWNSSSLSWELMAEFQMKDYRGEGTLTPGSLNTTGNPDAGPGLWYLRLPDAAPFSGQVVFGNTGGWISSRPAIFASFTPSPPA